MRIIWWILVVVVVVVVVMKVVDKCFVLTMVIKTYLKLVISKYVVLLFAFYRQVYTFYY